MHKCQHETLSCAMCDVCPQENTQGMAMACAGKPGQENTGLSNHQLTGMTLLLPKFSQFSLIFNMATRGSVGQVQVLPYCSAACTGIEKELSPLKSVKGAQPAER